MERQERDDELSTTGAQELLASPSAAHLAYLGRDGTPRVIPVGFFWTGDQVVISSATTSPKVAALSACPDVALTIDAGDTPDQARALSIRGRACVEIVDGVVAEYLAAARKTMGAEAAAEFEQNVRGLYEQMARIVITPHWVRTTTSARAECRVSFRNWPSGTGPDGRAAGPAAPAPPEPRKSRRMARAADCPKS